MRDNAEHTLGAGRWPTKSSPPDIIGIPWDETQ